MSRGCKGWGRRSFGKEQKNISLLKEKTEGTGCCCVAFLKQTMERREVCWMVKWNHAGVMGRPVHSAISEAEFNTHYIKLNPLYFFQQVHKDPERLGWLGREGSWWIVDKRAIVFNTAFIKSVDIILFVMSFPAGQQQGLSKCLLSVFDEEGRGKKTQSDHCKESYTRAHLNMSWI